ILRATQFFEFLGAIAGPGSNWVQVSDAPMQPLAADDVAATLADVAGGPPAHGVLGGAGPESVRISPILGTALSASGGSRPVVADSKAGYYGAALDKRGLRPDGANPRIGPTHFERWLDRVAARV